MEQVCKECNITKDLVEYYKHPEGRNWVLWRCKECIKTGRKSERERVMARIVDKNRMRPEWYNYNRTVEYRESNPKKHKAHKIVSNYYRYHKEDKPTICSICNAEKNIELHHEDYNNPREVIPLCSLCHSHYHMWKISIAGITPTIF